MKFFIFFIIYILFLYLCVRLANHGPIFGLDYFKTRKIWRITHKNCSKEINSFQEFLDALKIPSIKSDIKRIAHCWGCRTPLSSADCDICPLCARYICKECGRCDIKCDYNILRSTLLREPEEMLEFYWLAATKAGYKRIKGVISRAEVFVSYNAGLKGIYNSKGYDYQGYDRDGYDIEGYDSNDLDRNKRKRVEVTGYTRYGYDIDGYDREGFDCRGYDRRGLNRKGLDINGYDINGFSPNGFDREGYDKEGFNKWGYDKMGYNRYGYNKNGFDRDGFDTSGYSAEGYNRNGYNKYGYDKEGYNAEGYNKYGFNREGHDVNGYTNDLLGKRVKHISSGVGTVVGVGEKGQVFMVKYDDKTKNDGRFRYIDSILKILTFLDYEPTFPD